MTFSWLIDNGKKGVLFKTNGSFTMPAAAGATIFDAQASAQAMMQAAKHAVLEKMKAARAATVAQAAPGASFRMSVAEERLRSSLKRLESAKLTQIRPRPTFSQIAAQSLWAVVLSDGRWARLVSGMCAPGEKEEAAFFASREEAVSWARSDAWTAAAQPFQESARLIQIEIKLQAMEPVFKAGGANDLADAWSALEEAKALSEAAQSGAQSAQARAGSDPKRKTRKKAPSRL